MWAKHSRGSCGVVGSCSARLQQVRGSNPGGGGSRFGGFWPRERKKIWEIPCWVLGLIPWIIRFNQCASPNTDLTPIYRKSKGLKSIQRIQDYMVVGRPDNYKRLTISKKEIKNIYPIDVNRSTFVKIIRLLTIFRSICYINCFNSIWKGIITTLQFLSLSRFTTTFLILYIEAHIKFFHRLAQHRFSISLLDLYIHWSMMKCRFQYQEKDTFFSHYPCKI